MNDLKPCPFCGAPARMWPAQVFVGNDIPESIGCSAECSAGPCTDYMPYDEAVAAWNRRSDDAELARLRAAIAPLVELGRRVKADAAGATKGPWAWEVNRRSKRVELCGGKGASDLTVMSFTRYGMSNAAPVFWFWKGNRSDEPQRADLLAVPAKGREHHADWFARIDHPDARLIAAAPDMAAALVALVEATDA